MFNGTIQSDFLKIPALTDSQKADLIDFAATDFVTIREALVNYIKATYPLDYQNFSESDLGMMLIELISYMGAVMSLKADMLANENFLATARNRNNVKKLLELIGVRMKGPIGSVANATLTLDVASTDETITIYDNCTGTATVTTRCSVVISSTSNEPIFIPFSDSNPLTAVKGLIIRKSDPACIVTATIFVK